MDANIEASLLYGLFELLMFLIIIVLPIIISYIFFYRISKNKIVSAIASIIGVVGTLVIGYRGAFEIISKLTGALYFPYAPIIMSISMITGTILIGLVFTKFVEIFKNIIQHRPKL
jgi:hypothetical protein